MKKSIRNINVFMLLLFCLPIIVLSCNKEALISTSASDQSSNIRSIGAATQAAGATQLSGIGFLAETGECNPELSEGAAYVIKMTGDLEGCWYAYVDEYECSPSGTYREKGREYFVGTYKGESGTFWTGYQFEGKYEGCSESGLPVGAEIFGRCQHPIVEGSGTGVFEGASGRFDFKDDIVAGNFPYKGHVK